MHTFQRILRFFFSKFFILSLIHIENDTKSIISRKLSIAQKKSFMKKMSVRSISIYPDNLATFQESLIFGRPKRPFWTPAAPKRDMM